MVKLGKARQVWTRMDKMEFKDFYNKLSTVLKAESSASAFTRTIFEAIIPEEKYDLKKEYSDSTFKGYSSGNSISRIAKKINSVADPMLFEEYINNHEDVTIEKLCSVFADDIPGLTAHNAGELISTLFSDIISEAASTNKKSAHKDANHLGSFSGIAPELTPENADNIFFIEPSLINETEEDLTLNPFQKYLDLAIAYNSTKKTMLYAETPHPFYDLYVCNDISYVKFRNIGENDYKAEKNISNVTIDKLKTESTYSIIQGIGGIGKSMLLTHLFLSSARQVDTTHNIPILLLLKNYSDTTCGIVDFLFKSVSEYDSDISQSDILTALQNKQLIILLDGMDEIQSSIRDSFNQDLEAFIKSYPDNTIIMTSRPINQFVSYTKFSVFDIKPLTKPQAIELVTKLEFWDTEGKHSFLKALDRTLYQSHYQFASNPLLLTIMLMTYSSFGEVPAKMHVFYSKAYETMARLHDASKGSFKRPLHTNLTPEEFAKFFAQFCARTYSSEILEFDERLFTNYMDKVLKDIPSNHKNITSRDFLLDLTNNLCIMYREGEKYYFIHRSFQEYFAAVHFASFYDAKLKRVGNFFENIKNRSYTDKTFDMLNDMIPEKIERFIFLPFLENLLKTYSEKGPSEEYWEFLEDLYPVLIYEEGNTGMLNYTTAQSFLYNFILRTKELYSPIELEDHCWTPKVRELPQTQWVTAYTVFLDYDSYDKYPDPDAIPDKILQDTSEVSIDELPYKYEAYFGRPACEGISIEIDINELRDNPHRYADLRKHMEDSSFPLFIEFENIKRYYKELKMRTQYDNVSDDLFDD